MGAIPLSLRPALEQYEKRLRALFGDRLRAIRLFGSCARGEADEDSDVDVLADDLTDRELDRAIDEATYVRLETRVPLAPLPMATSQLDELRRQGRLIARDLDEEGIPL